MKKGTLFGIGVGPGDPELITLKAVNTVKSVSVVFAAASTKNEYSHALDIVRQYLPENAEVKQLNFPMTYNDRELNEAWQTNACQVLKELNSGRDACFLTLGDPLTYSTYAYLIKALADMDPMAKIVTIPGITSYNAAAARLNVPLVEGKESLMIVSGVSGRERVRELIEATDNAVILKPYKNFDEICETVRSVDPKAKMMLVSHCGGDEERIELNASDIASEKIPYLSLLLVKKESANLEVTQAKISPECSEKVSTVRHAESSVQ